MPGHRLVRPFLPTLLVALAIGCAERAEEPTAGPPDSRQTTTEAQPSPESTPATDPHLEGRLTARPDPAVGGSAPEGLRQMPAAGEGSLLFVPRSYRRGRAAPFALTLHGCCGEAKAGLNLWLRYAKRTGMILLAPDGGGTWGFGDPVARIDAGMGQVFEDYAVDPDHVAVVGFSAGASFALSLGVTNGDLFTHVVSHSPGGFSAGEPHGNPRIFVAHGVDDRTLPIESTSRQIVPELERAGHRVRYVEFDAGHRPQPTVMQEAVDWFLDG